MKITDDELLVSIRAVLKDNKTASISLIQAKFSIGYTRAKKLLDIAKGVKAESADIKPVAKLTDDELLSLIIANVMSDTNTTISKLQKLHSISFNRAKRLFDLAKIAIETKNAAPVKEASAGGADAKKLTDDELQTLILTDIIQNANITISYIQKKYQIGFTRAKRLFELTKAAELSKKSPVAEKPKEDASEKIEDTPFPRNKTDSYRSGLYKTSRRERQGTIPRTKKLHRQMLRSNIKRNTQLIKRKAAKAKSIRTSKYTKSSIDMGTVRLPKKGQAPSQRVDTIDCPVCDAVLIDDPNNDNVQCGNCGEKFGKSDGLYDDERNKRNKAKVIAAKRRRFNGLPPEYDNDEDDETDDKPAKQESNTQRLNRKIKSRKANTVGSSNRRTRLARANRRKFFRDTIDNVEDTEDGDEDLVTPTDDDKKSTDKKKPFILDILSKGTNGIKGLGIKLITKHILGSSADNSATSKIKKSMLNSILNAISKNEDETAEKPNSADNADNADAEKKPKKRPKHSKNRRPGESFEDFVTRSLDYLLNASKKTVTPKKPSRPINDIDKNSKNAKSGRGNKLIASLAKRGALKAAQSFGGKGIPALGIAAAGSAALMAGTMGVNAVMDKVLGQRDSDTSNNVVSKDEAEFGNNFDAGKNITGLSDDQTKALGSIVAKKESGLQYSGKNAWNWAGYVGAYQMGAEALETVGLIKKGRYAAARKIHPSADAWFKGGEQKKFLETDSNWTLSGGVQTFLDSPRIQDKAFADLANSNISYAKSSKVRALDDNSTPEQIAGFVAAAHLKGAGNAAELVKSGSESSDGNGSSNKSYYDNATGNLGAVTKAIQNKAAGLDHMDGEVTETNATVATEGPVPGARITSKFGPRNVKGGSKNHKGVDYGVAVGTPVHSIDDGKVTIVGSNPNGYGNWVEIEHANGIKSRYGHLETALVKQGQEVKSGQQIAKSGNSGASTGPHLHFEVLKNGSQIDPLPFLNARKQTKAAEVEPPASVGKAPATKGDSVARAASERGNSAATEASSFLPAVMSNNTAQPQVQAAVAPASTQQRQIGNVPQVENASSMMPFQHGGAESLRRKPASLERILNADATRSV